ncbi:MAG: hypothetical protein FWD61_12210 [Phycisphaerales bacterium]|nr:hypothetical protein [Phycisphaerales bacterium]
MVHFSGICLRKLAGVIVAGGLLAGCQAMGGGETRVENDPQGVAALASEPLSTQAWQFGNHAGVMIATPHYRVYTTIGDPIYQRLLAKLLEANFARSTLLNPQSRVSGPLDCYVFATRGQWETYTRVHAGGNAAVYLQIAAGGYCQEGVFAGYDIGREPTLSVVAHEAWHQYAHFAFKDRLPAWLDEGLATQNEAIDWQGTLPVFRPELNYRRFLALKAAMRENRLWKLSDLASTHAGRVIKLSQRQVDAYYAQVWSFVRFLESSPRYRQGLQRLLADANDGRLVQSLKGMGVSRIEIERFSENWNTVAGPTYLRKYICDDVEMLQREYEAWAREFVSTWPPRVKKPEVRSQ